MGDNACDDVFEWAARDPDRATFAAKADGAWQPVTAKQFADRVTAVAAGLIAAGIQPGDRIGLMSATSLDWVVCDFAIWAAGAVTVPVYETSSVEQIRWILADSGAVAVFAGDARCAEGIRAAQAAKVEAVWQIDGGGLDALATTGQGVTAGEIDRRRDPVTAATLATIVYTSGTTGRPKGCMISHGNLSEAVRAITGIPGVRERVLTEGLLQPFLPAPVAHPGPDSRAVPGARRPADRFPLRSRRAARGAGRLPPDDPAGGATRVREGCRRSPRAGRSRGSPAAVRRRRGHGDRLQPCGTSPARCDLARTALATRSAARRWIAKQLTAVTTAAQQALGRSLAGRDRDRWHAASARQITSAARRSRSGQTRLSVAAQMREHWLIEECVVVGDQRPYIAALVTLDQAAFARWKRRQGKPASATVGDLSQDPDLLAAVREAVDRANTAVSRAEGIKRFRILPGGFAVGAELTQTQKVRRDYVLAKFATDVEALYA